MGCLAHFLIEFPDGFHFPAFNADVSAQWELFSKHGCRDEAVLALNEPFVNSHCGQEHRVSFRESKQLFSRHLLFQWV